ncbi:hypothetical protein PAT3040_03978 [Paenibacillus agaridevorans]|uniref:Uncharacterized protein n=1 Tax=Paenibacillus agaridevorans TaxID=171404 RepID=A0A2R5F0Z8_9BACL|nr:hypothetical protein [Paenibacillus agaridevorans]GBG09334.1 hypothetical protein PAT3040_03978 [Paenibacillus agaridevorans]
MDASWTDQFDIYVIDLTVLDGMDWALVVGSVLGTLLCVFAMVYWLYKLILGLWQMSAGRANFHDRSFWIRMLVVLILIMAAMSGLWFIIIAQLLESIQQSLERGMTV